MVPRSTPAPTKNVPGSGRTERGGPYAEMIPYLRQNPVETNAFLEKDPNDASTRAIQSTLMHETADKLFHEKKYKDACMNYIKAAAAMLGRDLPINGPFSLKEYEKVTPDWQLADMMACLNGAAESLVPLRQYKQVRP